MPARATEQQIGTASRPPGDRAILLLLLLLSALAMTVLAVLRDRLDLPAGDEPHYLIMSQALQLYHSLDVQRVYDASDYRVFYPRPIQPHTVPGPGGRLLPLHAVGGPVLWLVQFALAGRAGVMAFMVGVSLLTVANVFLLDRTLGVGTRTAFAVGLAFAVGTPILTYSSMSFVEPIGALICVYALRLLHTTRLRTRDLLAVSTALGVQPWVHARFLLFPPLFAVFLLLRMRRDGATRRQYITAITPLALLLLALEVYNLLLWHTASPAPNQVTAGAVPFQNNLIPGLIGTARDPGIGVLPNFPIFILVLPGILLTTHRRWRSLHLQLAALVVPYTWSSARFRPGTAPGHRPPDSPPSYCPCCRCTSRWPCTARRRSSCEGSRSRRRSTPPPSSRSPCSPPTAASPPAPLPARSSRPCSPHGQPRPS